MATGEYSDKDTVANKDAHHKIQNARRVARAGEKRVDRTFLESKSVGARAREKRFQKKDGGKAAKRVSQKAQQKSTQQPRRYVKNIEHSNLPVPSASKKLGGFAKWGGLSIAGIIYIWQLLFGILSLVGFATQASIEYYQQETFVGQVTSYVIDLGEFFPGAEMGLVFWGLASVLSFGAFLAWYLWYRFAGIRPLGTMASAFLSAICFAFSLLPVTNLFPWHLGWIVYINVSSIFLKS